MAESQARAVGRPVRLSSQPIVIATILSVLLVAAIAVAVLAGGVLVRGSSAQPGDVGSPEWMTFRAGERGAVSAATTDRVSLNSGFMVDFRRCERDGC